MFICSFFPPSSFCLPEFFSSPSFLSRLFLVPFLEGKIEGDLFTEKVGRGRKRGREGEDSGKLTSENGNHCYDHNDGYHPSPAQTETRTGSPSASVAVDFGARAGTPGVVIAIFRG